MIQNYSEGYLKKIPDELLAEEVRQNVETIYLNLNSMPNFELPKTIDNSIVFPKLCKLFLGVNSLKTFPDFSSTPNLKELYLNNNFITSIDTQSLACLTRLVVLDMRSNRLTSINFPDEMKELKWLSLSKNCIERVEYFPPMPKLVSFCIFGNMKLSLQDCELILKQFSSKLKKLFIGGTGISSLPSPTIEESKKIYSLVPSLRFLDGSYVSRKKLSM